MSLISRRIDPDRVAWVDLCTGAFLTQVKEYGQSAAIICALVISCQAWADVQCRAVTRPAMTIANGQGGHE